MASEKNTCPAKADANGKVPPQDGKADHSGHRSRMRLRYRQDGLAAFKEHEVLEMLLYRTSARGNTNPLAHTLLEKAGSMEAVLANRVSAAGVGVKTRALLEETGNRIQQCFLQTALAPKGLPDREQFYTLAVWFLRRYPERVLLLVQGEAGEPPEVCTVENADLRTLGTELYAVLSGENGEEKHFCLACMGSREELAALRKSEAGTLAHRLLSLSSRWEPVWL